MNDIRSFNSAPSDPRRWRVTRGKVLVKREPTNYKIGSIHVPQTSRYVDRNIRATVIGVGSDVTHVKPGDVLLLGDVMDVLGKVTWNGDTYTFLDAKLCDLVEGN